MSANAVEVFGGYQLQRRLAFGGMAEIFLASLCREQGFAKRVVLKRILPQYSADEAFVRMFVDEAVLAAKINHPNVVQVYDFGSVDGVYFIAMEYVDGVDLRRVLGATSEQCRKLTLAQSASIGESVARGLSHAHNLRDDSGVPLGIVHRDVSPHNIMISRTGDVKVMDFGIAKAQARATKTATGTIKGKIAYMAPEQAAGRALDKRADQFALGVVLWECLAGRRLFTGGSDLELLRAVVSCAVPALEEVAEDVPKALCRTIERCLRADPSERYSDISQLADELAAFRYSLGREGVVDLSELLPSIASSAVAPAANGRPRGTLPLPKSPATDAGAGPKTGAPAPQSNDVVATGYSREPSSSPPARTVTGTGWDAADDATATTTAQAGPAPVALEPQASGGATRWTPVRAGLALKSFDRRLAFGGAALLLVLLAAVGALFGARWGSTAPADVMSVTVTSQPPSAEIWLDGRYTGLRTPALLPKLAADRSVEIELVRAGYVSWRDSVLPAARTDVAAVLERIDEQPEAQPEHEGTSSNSVGESAGGSASPDEVRTQRSSTDAKPSSGSSKGRVGLRSSGRASRHSKPQAGAEQPDRVPLRPKSATLWLRSTGVWVEVHHRGRKLGTTPLVAVPVPAGQLRLRLVNEAEGIDRIVVIEAPAGEVVRRTISP